MALINCPECGKQISDKAKSCIYCGYPINQEEPANVLYSVIFEGFIRKSDNVNNAKVAGQIKQIANVSLQNAVNIINNPHSVILDGITEDNATWIKSALEPYGCTIKIVKSNLNNTETNNRVSTMSSSGASVVCPRCGSTFITTGQKGFSLLTGFLGSNKTVNRCGKCGYTWQP